MVAKSTDWKFRAIFINTVITLLIVVMSVHGAPVAVNFSCSLLNLTYEKLEKIIKVDTWGNRTHFSLVVEHSRRKDNRATCRCSYGTYEERGSYPSLRTASERLCCLLPIPNSSSSSHNTV